MPCKDCAAAGETEARLREALQSIKDCLDSCKYGENFDWPRWAEKALALPRSHACEVAEKNQKIAEAAITFAYELADFNAWDTHPEIGSKFRRLKEIIAAEPLGESKGD